MPAAGSAAALLSWQAAAAVRAASISCSLVADVSYQLHGSTAAAAVGSGVLRGLAPTFPAVSYVFVFVESGRQLQQQNFAAVR
jgi:hypothetical protein